MNKITSAFLLILTFSSLFAQVGPGGVGNADNNQMWLSGDFGTFIDNGTTPASTDGNRVRQWNDRSGNGRNATSNTLGNRPIFEDDAANGKPGLRFTGNLFIDGPSPGISANSGYTYLIAFRDTISTPGGTGGTNDGSGHSGHFILDRTNETNALVSLKPVNNSESGNRYFYQKRNNTGGGLGGVPSDTLVNTSTKLIQMRRDYNINYQIFYNNQNQGTLSDNDGSTTPPVPRLGRHAATANGGLRGYINEFIVYNYAINTAQTTIVNNYLSAKYGLSLGANDLYTMDNPANGDYDHEVAGIGRINATNLHNDAQGSGIIRILNPSNLNNGEFLFWGHDDGDLEFTDEAGSPSTDFVKLERVWRVSEVNTSNTAVDVGSTDIRIDVSNLNSIPPTAIVLLIDTNNDGSFTDETPIENAVNIGGGYIEFSNVSDLTDQSRFTLGVSKYIFDTDGDWEVASNWKFNSIPAVANNAFVIGNATITQDQQINNLTVDPSYSVNVNSGQVLNVSGDLVNNGDFTGDGEVILNGTSAQAISGTGSFENLRLDNSISVSIDNPDNTPINLNGVLYVDQGILNTDNNLYLRCAFGTTGTPGTPPKTAQVGQVASGSSINGDVTVEQCFPARRAFRLISPSVTTTTTINANWQEGVNNPNTTGNLNPNPGYGTHITGSETGADGFDATGSGNPSLFTFNNVGRSWEAISNTDVNTLDANQPYRLFIRGGRDINVTNNSSDPTPTKLRVTGALETGEQFQTDLSSTAGSFNLIANPYHAQVDMRLLTASSTNISNTEYYVWDPTLGGAPTVGQTGGRGAYVTVNLSDGSTSFLDTGISGSPSNTANEFLQPMQAAFVLVNGSGASVDFEESHKDVSPVQTETKSLSQSEYINIQLFDSDSYNSGETPSDGLRINFDKSFSAASEDDSPKLGNLDENLARIKGNAYSAIERRPFPETEERLELFINQYRREAYVMKFNLTDNLNTKVFIEDMYLNQTQEITSNDDIYSFTVDESISESTASDRFSLVFEPISLSTVEETLVEASLYPNPTKGSFRISGANLGEDAKIEIYNMIGQQVYKTNLKNQSTTEITNFNGSAGVYLVKLKTNQGERTFKLIKQ